MAGETVNVEIVVANNGSQDYTEDIVVALDVTLEGSSVPTSLNTFTILGGLEAGTSTTLTYGWNTLGVAVGDHVLTAVHNVDDENNTNDSGAALVTHTLTASHDLADDDASNDVNTTSVVVVEDVVQEMEVLGLTSRVSTIGRSGKWQAFVTAEISEVGGSALSGVTVFGKWEGAYAADPVSAITDSSGSVTFSTPVLTSGSAVTFTVTGADGFEYNGTDSIVVTLDSAKSKSSDLDALIGYLASVTNERGSAKRDVDEQAEAVDLLMAYGL